MILRDAIEVNAPAAAIFAFFERMDEHYLAWHPDHRVFRWTRGRGLTVGNRAYFEEIIGGKLLKKEIEYTRIEPGRLIEFVPVMRLMRFFLPSLSFRLESIQEGLWRVVAEIHLRVGPLGEWANQREFAAVREHMRVEGVNLKRMVEAFVATGQWPGDGAARRVDGSQSHAGDALAHPDRASTEAHEADVQRRVDARCLENMLLWLRRSLLLVPLGLLWTWLAWENGAGAWALAWLALWVGTQAHVYWTAGRLQAQANGDVQLGIARATRLYWIAGVLHAALLPQFFFGTSIETKLGISLLLTQLSGATVISCSGIRRAYVAVMLPLAAVLVAGWLWHGGVLGYGLAFLFTLGTAGGVTAVVQQRRSWEALVRLADDRERLAASLAAERDRAEAASASRTRFFASASHDLRQPLHALSINATTLELLAKRAGDPRLADISRDIGRSLAQSKGLLDALLDISRLDAGAVQPHPAEVDIAEVLRQLHAEFAGVAAQRRLGFELDLPRTAAWARTDAEQLQRVLRNLLDNAFKFTDQGSVTLSLRYERGRGRGDGDHRDEGGASSAGIEGRAGVLRIGVADTGCGIAASDRDKVFEEFFQVGNPTRDRNRGLGLGLAIVQRTAELLGARVSVRGNGARGSVFEIELPALPASERPAPPVSAVIRTNSRTNSSMTSRSTAHDEPSRALSVLLVDDETDIVSALASLMSARGWHAISATSVDTALAIADDLLPPRSHRCLPPEGAGPTWERPGGGPARTIDVAVIDHRLPGGDGIDLIARLRERRPDLPALIVTGDVAVQWQVRRHSLRVLHKPLDGDALTQAITEEASAAARWASRMKSFTGPNGEPPMNIIDAIHGRRSVREYRADPVDSDVIEDLIWHASLVPRPPISDDATWAFHVLSGRERLADFGARAKQYATDHQPPGEPWTWPLRGDFDVFWGAPLAVLIAARRGHPEAPFDCCRAGQNFALLAHARGLGTCWLGSALPWLNSAEGRAATGLPEGYEVAVAMVVGHPAESTPGRSAPRPVVTWCE